MKATTESYKEQADICKSLFLAKTRDYGTAWRVLRLTSLTDQMYIKASRIRSIEQTGVNKVGEDITHEFMALVNYGIMALIQLELGEGGEEALPVEDVERLYDRYLTETYDLMLLKNHDYGEAWRGMRISSITDLILMKLLRIRSIEDNEGITEVSEGLDANYMDIINYALFALIRLDEIRMNN